MPTSETELKTRENVAEPKPARSIQSSVKQLKRLRQQLIKALAEAADGPPAMIDGLTARIQSLSTAIDAIGKGEGKVRDQRITLAAVTGAVLLTGTLLLLHRTSAEILMETKASDVSFTVTTPFAPLRDVAGVASVEVVGLAKISQEGLAEIVARPDEDLRMRVASAPGTKNPGSVGFDSLLIPAGTQVEFTELSSGKNIELRFQFPTGQTPALDLDVTGDLTIFVQGQGQRKADFPAPARITVEPIGEARLVLQFNPRNVVFQTPIAVESIAWNQDSRNISGYPGGAWRDSSILSGKLSLEEFRDKFVDLRTGVPVHLGGPSGRIRQLSFDGRALSCQFDGTVKALTIGEGSRKQNLMPTLLEWLRQRDALIQFWAVVVYLAGLGLAASRWWKGT